MPTTRVVTRSADRDSAGEHGTARALHDDADMSPVWYYCRTAHNNRRAIDLHTRYQVTDNLGPRRIHSNPRYSRHLTPSVQFDPACDCGDLSAGDGDGAAAHGQFDLGASVNMDSLSSIQRVVVVGI